MAVNSRQKGKRIERFFSNLLKPIFPDIRRNAGTQAQSGGKDLENTPGFNFEVKGGKQAKIVKIRKWIDQCQEQGFDGEYDVVLVKPDREQEYAIIPIEDFLKMIEKLV